MNDFLDLVQGFQLALKALLMYTGSHPRAQAAIAALAGRFDAWLADQPTLHLAASQGKLFLDGAPVEGKSLHLAALSRQLGERQISGIIFRQGLTLEELGEVLALLALKPARIEEAGGAGAILASKRLSHVQLSQTQYQEVRAGTGQDGQAGPGRAGAPGEGAAAAAPAAPAADLPGSPAGGPEELRQLTGRWREVLAQLAIPAPGEGGAAPADLGPLARTEAALAFGDGFPPAHQIEGLRQALFQLPGPALLAVVAGLDSLPDFPPGLGMGFRALAGEAFVHAAGDLLRGEGSWPAAAETLAATGGRSAQRPSLLAALAAAARDAGTDPALLARLQELIRQLQWEDQSMEEKLRLAGEQGQLWTLSMDQRLRFLRRLLDEGRIEGFMGLLEQLLDALRQERAELRSMAAWTLNGVTRWLESPGLPPEAEGPLVEALAAHFAWEPLANLHRASAEALAVVLPALVARDRPGAALALCAEVTALCALQDARQDWREAALAGLGAALAAPACLERVVERLHSAEPACLNEELIPYLKAAGQAGGRCLVAALGTEPERKRRGRLLEVLRGLGEAALPAILASLEAPAWYLVRNALNLLGDIGVAEGLDPVRACLGHPDGRVKRAAVRTLWKVGGAAAVPALLAAFPAVEPETQLEIMFALGQVRAVQAVAVLAGFAQERRHPERLRIRAAETIGQIGDPGSVPVLAELARRKGRIFTTAEPIAVRVSACRALVAVGSAQAIESLSQVVAAEPWNKDRGALQQVLSDHLKT